MKNIWDVLLTPPASDDVLNPLSVVYLVVFVVGFLVVAYWLRGEGSPAAVASAAEEWSRSCLRICLCIFGAGLVFFAVRALQITPLFLGAPIWMILAVVALVVAAWRWIAEQRTF
jgi:uncharacterized membrane protein YadS